MPKDLDFDESRIAEACKAVLSQKKPKIEKIARQFGVSRTTLNDRVKKAKSPITPTKSLKNLLEPHQETALVNWMV
jgi:transposase-like protein